MNLPAAAGQAGRRSPGSVIAMESGTRLTIDDERRRILIARPGGQPGTGVVLFPRTGALPAAWAGPVPAVGLDPDDVAALLAAVQPCGLLPQHGEGWFGRPGLSGHRLGPGPGDPAAPAARPGRAP